AAHEDPGTGRRVGRRGDRGQRGAGGAAGPRRGALPGRPTGRHSCRLAGRAPGPGRRAPRDGERRRVSRRRLHPELRRRRSEPGRPRLRAGWAAAGAARAPPLEQGRRPHLRPRTRRRARMRLTWIARVTVVALLALLAGGAPSVAAQPPVELTFYYPVAVGGPVTKIIDGLAADF